MKTVDTTVYYQGDDMIYICFVNLFTKSKINSQLPMYETETMMLVDGRGVLNKVVCLQVQ